ncbi:MAG: heavy-metal-associated domain-containing protein [Pseudomonadota bacterium]
MLEFQIPDMSCGHCVGAVTKACHEVDPAAKVNVDLAGKKVSIDSSVEPQRFSDALAEAGYPPAA